MILDSRIGCSCEVRADMTDDELMKVQSCNSRWVCSTLDKIRRLYVDLGRHYREEDARNALGLTDG